MAMIPTQISMRPREIGVCSPTDPSQKQFGIPAAPRTRPYANLRRHLTLFLLLLPPRHNRPPHVEFIAQFNTNNRIGKPRLPASPAAVALVSAAPSHQIQFARKFGLQTLLKSHRNLARPALTLSP